MSSSSSQPIFGDLVDALPYVDNDLEAIPGASSLAACLPLCLRAREGLIDRPCVLSPSPPGLREQAEALVAQELQKAGGLKDVHERFPEGMVSEEDLFKVRLACRSLIDLAFSRRVLILACLLSELARVAFTTRELPQSACTPCCHRSVGRELERRARG